MKTSIKEQIVSAFNATGVDLSVSAADVAAYIAERSAHLALAVDEPGFDEALEAEQNKVWMYVARRAVRAGDAADARTIGIIRGVLLGLAGA